MTINIGDRLKYRSSVVLEVVHILAPCNGHHVIMKVVSGGAIGTYIDREHHLLVKYLDIGKDFDGDRWERVSSIGGDPTFGVLR